MRDDFANAAPRSLRRDEPMAPAEFQNLRCSFKSASCSLG